MEKKKIILYLIIAIITIISTQLVLGSTIFLKKTSNITIVNNISYGNNTYVYNNITNNYTINYSGFFNQYLNTTSIVKFANIYNKTEVDNLLNNYYLLTNPLSFINITQAQVFNDTAYIDSRLQTITYYPSQVITKYGTNTAGNNVGNLSYIDDNFYNVTEVAGINALEVLINFTNVTTNFTNIQVYMMYQGGTSHEVDIMLWDYESNTWEEYRMIGTSNSYILYNIGVADSDSHIQNNITQLRIVHLSNGIAGHKLSIDETILQKGMALIGTGETHDPSKLDIIGGSLTGNINMTNNSIVTINNVEFSNGCKIIPSGTGLNITC